MSFKSLFIAFFVLFVAGPAIAAVNQCVKLNPDTVCTTVVGNYNRSDTTVDCDGQQVSMVGVCAQNSGTADVSVRDSITTSTTQTKNYYCWCMMVEPVPSRWVLRANYTNIGSCRMQCNIGCRNAFIYDNSADRSFRNVIMSNLIQ